MHREFQLPTVGVDQVHEFAEALVWASGVFGDAKKAGTAVVVVCRTFKSTGLEPSLKINTVLDTQRHSLPQALVGEFEMARQEVIADISDVAPKPPLAKRAKVKATSVI